MAFPKHNSLKKPIEAKVATEQLQSNVKHSNHDANSNLQLK